jgi:hypothetical protein
VTAITVTIESSRLSKQQLAQAVSNFGRSVKAHDETATLTVHEPRGGRPIMVDVVGETMFTERGPFPAARRGHRILLFLYQRGDIVTPEEIADHLGLAFEKMGSRTSVRSLIRRTRVALGSADLIETVRGHGYRLNRAYTYIETGESR